MPKAEPKAGLNLPARFIPTPTTISPEAQAFLSAGNPFGEARAQPDPKDKAAWRTHIAESDAFLAAMFTQAEAALACEIVEHGLSGTILYELTPPTCSSQTKALYFIHGGGYTVGGGRAAALAALRLAHLTGLKIYSVDYRMPPDHPFPAGLNDSVEGYRFVLERFEPEAVVVYGPSAGGGLAASCILKARDSGLPLPAACVLSSPEADLTEAGDSFETNAGLDPILQRLTNANLLYADGHDLKDPYLSPLFGDFTKGFPATLLSTGTRDLFLSNTVLMHRALRRAGVKADLHVFEAMGHGGFLGRAPEDEELMQEHVRFIKQVLALD